MSEEHMSLIEMQQLISHQQAELAIFNGQYDLFNAQLPAGWRQSEFPKGHQTVGIVAGWDRCDPAAPEYSIGWVQIHRDPSARRISIVFSIDDPAWDQTEPGDWEEIQMGPLSAIMHVEKLLKERGFLDAK
jgi:hypothetical protein